MPARRVIREGGIGTVCGIVGEEEGAGMAGVLQQPMKRVQATWIRAATTV
jgi:hypothetical protein